MCFNKCEWIFFLITASHVINNRFFTRNNEIYLYDYINSKYILLVEDILGGLEPDSHKIPDYTDVAIIKLSSSTIIGIPINFFTPLENVVFDDFTLNENDQIYMCIGYPQSKNNNIKRGENKFKAYAVINKKAVSLNKPIDDSTYSRTPEDLLNFEIEFVKNNFSRLLFDNYEKINAPDPYGMSGGDMANERYW